MRRSLSILLVLFVGLPLISPLLALSPDVASLLPACCRRQAVHHCASMMEGAMTSESQATALALKHHLKAPMDCCPAYPKAISQSQHQDLSCNTAALHFAEAVSHPAVHSQTEAWARVALDGARQKRGPPATHLS